MKKRVCFGALCLLFSFLLIPRTYADERRALELLFPRAEYHGTLKESGEEVRILEADDGKHFLIADASGARKRIAWEALVPKAVSTPVAKEAKKTEIERFAGAVGIKSDTGFLVWTDLLRLKVYVLEYGDEGWDLLRSLPCTVGDAYHPTPTGVYLLDYKCTCIGKENMYLCRYAMCFYGSYMFHSVLYDWGGKAVIDGRLGERISHGCVRLSPEDSRWLYETVPVGSTVLIR